MPITEILKDNVKKFPSDIALVELDYEKNIRKEISWLDFDKESSRFANYLLQKGIKKGDKVAILMMNSIRWLTVFFGILKTGALVVPLNFRYDTGDIKNCLKTAETDSLVFGGEFIERLNPLSEELSSFAVCVCTDEESTLDYAEKYSECIFGKNENAPEILIDDQDDGALYFTSGTTGFPKAILHRHLAFMTACITENKHHGQTKDDTFLCIPPLYHTGAIMHWFGSFLVGGKGVLLKGIKPEYILKAASEEKATIVWLLVPWAQDILDAIEAGKVNLNDYELSQWRLMHIGAQPVPPSLIHRWLITFPAHQYDTNYGLSESIGPGCIHLGVENVDHVGALGVAGYNWEAKVVNPDLTEAETGKVGELAVKGNGVMKCYYKNPEATSEVLKGDWLLTGDMAYKDDKGFFYIVDRKKDLIITGGENIFPVEIENYLRQHDKIKDVGVIGLPDDRLGEITAAIIEIKEGMAMTEEEVSAFCEGLPRYKRPKKIFFDRVPRNGTGKIEKVTLRERYCMGNLVEAQMK